MPGGYYRSLMLKPFMSLTEARMQAPIVLNRRLGRTEHIYWLLDQLYCLNFLAVAELEGSLNGRELRGSGR